MWCLCLVREEGEGVGVRFRRLIFDITGETRWSADGDCRSPPPSGPARERRCKSLLR